MNKKLLLLSNSTNPGEEYLKWPENHIQNFLGSSSMKILFMPFAGVTIDYDEYTARVAEAMQRIGHQVDGIHTKKISASLISQYDVIMVGGGNSFQLANLLGKHQLFEPVRTAVENGMPYIGWSAGSNMACPTLMTTNDMPIVQPATFNTFGLIPFQINPHYTEATIPNHGGESRNMRIMEFLALNRQVNVIGLPEGSLLKLANNKLSLTGKGPAKLFKFGAPVQSFQDGDDLSFLME